MRNIPVRTMLLSTALVLTGCVAQPPLLKSTVSGMPEGIFKDANIDTVKNKIIDGCTMKGYFVQEVTTNNVLCSKTVTGAEASFARIFVGNSHSTQPEKKAKFLFYQMGSDVKATAQLWYETQMTFGKINRMELNDNRELNSLQEFFFSIGAQ